MMDTLIRGLFDFVLLFAGMYAVIQILIRRSDKKQAEDDLLIASGVIDDAVFCSFHQAVQGGKLSSYFDADLYFCNPERVGTVLDWIKTRLEDHRRSIGDVDRFLFLENEDGPVGTLTLKDLVTWETKIPSGILRSGRKGPTLRIKVLNDELRKKPTEGYRAQEKPFTSNGSRERIIIINSVITTGTTVLNAVKRVEDGGGKVEGIFVLYSRSERYAIGQAGEMLTGEEIIQRESKIPVEAMFRASDLSELARSDDGLLEKAIKKGIIEDDAPKAFSGAS